MRSRLLLSLIVLFVIEGLAEARPVVLRLMGEYEATQPWSTSLRILVVGESEDLSDRLIAAEVTVGDKRCSGSFSGLGIVTGERIDIRPYKASGPESQCVVSVELDSTGKKAKLTESDCSYYQGAECNFNGVLHAR